MEWLRLCSNSYSHANGWASYTTARRLSQRLLLERLLVRSQPDAHGVHRANDDARNRLWPQTDHNARNGAHLRPDHNANAGTDHVPVAQPHANSAWAYFTVARPDTFNWPNTTFPRPHAAFDAHGHSDTHLDANSHAHAHAYTGSAHCFRECQLRLDRG